MLLELATVAAKLNRHMLARSLEYELLPLSIKGNDGLIVGERL